MTNDFRGSRPHIKNLYKYAPIMGVVFVTSFSTSCGAEPQRGVRSGGSHAIETLKPVTGLDAKVVENEIRVRPGEIVFHIPDSWIESYDKGVQNIHVERKELEAANDATSEWDSQYAKILNGVLPFEACAFQAGDEGWDKDSVSYRDLQFRLYLFENSPQAALDSIRKKVQPESLKTAVGLKSLPRAEERKQFDGQRYHIDAALWFGDYGDTANIDFVVRQLGKYTAVYVFMYSGTGSRESTINNIVSSMKTVSKTPKE